MLIKQVKLLVLRCNKPKAVWDRLAQEFKVKYLQNTLLQTKVNQRRLREGSSVKEHLHAMKEIYDHLTMLDNKVGKRGLNYKSAGKSTTKLQCFSIRIAITRSITWMDVQQTLIMEVQRELHIPRRHQTEVAISKRSFKGHYVQSTCYYCRKPGHFKQNCPDRCQTDRSNNYGGQSS